MPEYLSPGVYIEETSFRSKSIEGVSTTTAGFIGPCRFGPIDVEPDIVTSLVEFERVYGGKEKLDFEGTQMDGYLWHAVRAFFEEGGKRLYISRVFRPLDGGTIDECCSRLELADSSGTPGLLFKARYPGVAGDFRVHLILRLSQNILVREAPRAGAAVVPRLKGARSWDVVLVRNAGGGLDGFHLVEQDPATLAWSLVQREDPSSPVRVELEVLPSTPGVEVRRLTLTVVVEPVRGDTPTYVASDLALDRRHAQNGTPDSIMAEFEAAPSNIIRARINPLVVMASDPSNPPNGLEVLELLIALSESNAAVLSLPEGALSKTLLDMQSPDPARTLTLVLENGSDGKRPGVTEYEGASALDGTKSTGLHQFEDLEDISMVAAPGSTFGYRNGGDVQDDAQGVISLLISHCRRMRYRIAIIDSGNAQTISEVRAMRAKIDSSHAAMYYPWIHVVDPLTRQEIALPPSGFVAGIYARNDRERAVWKAPANEVVNLALRFEQTLSASHQDVLNPEGVNCFRFFEGRGNRLWGARTASSDPEWKYVNLRRYFAYLERSLERGTQWAVFEPNGERLWANVRRTVYDFVFNEWVSGALLGEKPEKAFFVKCDRSTMTQNDLDNGRLICLIGVAPLRPAEFVIFRIGQWTADRKV